MAQRIEECKLKAEQGETEKKTQQARSIPSKEATEAETKQKA